MKTIFKNGNVIDGTGCEGRIADVMVDDGRIVAIGQIDAGVNEQVIDATGKVICPGFIDTHTHSDLSCSAAIFFAPKRDKFCTARRCQKDTFCTVQK